jgi:hypothetical protein
MSDGPPYGAFLFLDIYIDIISTEYYGFRLLTCLNSKPCLVGKEEAEVEVDTVFMKMAEAYLYGLPWYYIW